MIGVMFAGLMFGGTGCNVVVANRGYVAQNYAVQHRAAYVAPSYQTVAYTPSYNYSPYYTASALAYKVEDPEKSSLVRQNEKLTDALVVELRASRERAERLESAIATSGDPSGGVPEPARNVGASASVVLKTNCLKCHAGDKPKGGFALSANPSLAQRLLINEVVAKGEMPPGKPLTDQDKKLIGAWAVVTREELKAASVSPAK